MADLWTTLLPLVIGSAVVPTQMVVTAVLLRSSRAQAAAWIAGMAALRVLQGALFGFVFSEALGKYGYLPPILAAWAPNLMFVGLGALLVLSLDT